MDDLGFQDDLNWDEQHHSFLSDESGDTAFLDEIMNDRTSLEELESMSDNDEELDEHVEPAKDSDGKSRKRTINDVEKVPLLPVKDGILFLYNIKIIMIIQIKA